MKTNQIFETNWITNLLKLDYLFQLYFKLKKIRSMQKCLGQQFYIFPVKKESVRKITHKKMKFFNLFAPQNKTTFKIYNWYVNFSVKINHLKWDLVKVYKIDVGKLLKTICLQKNKN